MSFSLLVRTVSLDSLTSPEAALSMTASAWPRYPRAQKTGIPLKTAWMPLNISTFPGLGKQKRTVNKIKWSNQRCGARHRTTHLTERCQAAEHWGQQSCLVSARRWGVTLPAPAPLTPEHSDEQRFYFDRYLLVLLRHSQDKQFKASIYFKMNVLP